MVDRSQRPIVPTEHADEREHRRQLASRANASMPKDGTEGMVAPHRLMQYTAAELPTASLWSGATVYVSDENKLAHSNGSTWVREAAGATLDAIALLTPTDSNFIVGDGSTWVAESGATARTSLGVSIGSQVQAWDADLDAIAALAKTDSNFIVGDGSTWVAESGSTVRTSLGLGTAATQNTGTSGANVPLLNGANTWSGANGFGASGELTGGTFSGSGASIGFAYNNRFTTSRNSTASVEHAAYFNPNGQVGSITTSGSATAFNTSSDERLKENLREPDPYEVGALIDKINIYDFDWKADGSPGFGPVAQEINEVVPAAVSVGGDDPTKQPWTWDASKLVPYLIVEIQSLRRRIVELEAKR